MRPTLLSLAFAAVTLIPASASAQYVGGLGDPSATPRWTGPTAAARSVPNGTLFRPTADPVALAEALDLGAPAPVGAFGDSMACGFTKVLLPFGGLLYAFFQAEPKLFPDEDKGEVADTAGGLAWAGGGIVGLFLWMKLTDGMC